MPKVLTYVWKNKKKKEKTNKKEKEIKKEY